MCGIAGILLKYPNPAASVHLKKMTTILAHRGPDGEETWSSLDNTVHLGHRRLSILDLSERGSQPMAYAGRYQIVHNGEVYNYSEIRDFLQAKGYQFSSRTDTEVIVAAYDFWKERCLQQFEGMFAFAIWDEKEKQLFAARDRFGEKPFYYYEDEENFVFASEMKALWKIGIDKTIDRKMLLNYLSMGHVQNCIDKEQTFYESIYSLPPAHYLTMNTVGVPSRIKRYWNINRENKIDISLPDASERFLFLLNNSVKYRLRSDVPLGTSLSGGIDSSAIAYTVKQFQQTSQDNGYSSSFRGEPLKTFSATFPGFERNEADYISQLSGELGITNYSTQPSMEELIRDFEKVCYHQEEPFQSSGIYAQFRVYALAREHNIKVLLDGQGADEILAGYPKYIHWYLQEVLSRHRIGSASDERKAFVRNGIPFLWDIKNIFAAFLPSHAAIQLEKKEYLRTIRQPDIDPDFIRSLRGREWEGIHKPIVTKLNDILYFNTMEMGLEELLRFADRNSMAHGREVRLPFLNHQLVEFIFSLPAQLKMHQGWTKFLLRHSMNHKLPDAITWRKEKVGFETPQKEWMKTPAMQEYIQESRRKLVNAHILQRKVLDRQIVPSAAHDEQNSDWRYLCAAQFI